MYKDRAENSHCSPANSILLLFCFEFSCFCFVETGSHAGLEIAMQLQVTLNSLLELGVCEYTSRWELPAYECAGEHMYLDACRPSGTSDVFLIYSLLWRSHKTKHPRQSG